MYITFKWSQSKARGTKGFLCCALFVNEKKVATECGIGYDLQSTVFSKWIDKEFGLKAGKTRILLPAIKKRLDKLGYKLSVIDLSRNESKYKLMKKVTYQNMDETVKSLIEYKAKHTLTNRQLAKKIGTSDVNISRWFNNKNSISNAWRTIIKEKLGI